VARVTEYLALDLDDLQSRRRRRDLVTARELLVLLGAGRYGIKVRELARQLRKSPDGISQALARAARKRATDTKLRAELDRLDHLLAMIEGARRR